MESKTFCLLLVILLGALSANAEWITLNVVVDDIVIGEAPVDLSSGGIASSVNGDALIKLLEPFVMDDKLQRIRKLTQQDQVLTLDDINRIGFGTAYSEKNLELILTIPIEMRTVKDFPMTIKRSKAGLSLYNQAYSGYFNYSLLAGYTSQIKPTSHLNSEEPKEGIFELVQNLNYFTFESTATYKEFQPEAVQRADTSLVHDFEYAQIRMRLGDYFTSSQAFQTSLPSAGLQVQKQFNIYPERGSLNKRSTIIQVRKNSLMEVYVNEILITRFRVNVGPYNLRDIPMLYGRNKVKVVLLDDFGGREEFEIDLFFDDQILAPGVHNFSYQIGVPSYYVDNEKLYYPHVFGSFFHQYGVTDQLTLSLNYQNYQTSRLMGGGFGFLTDIGTNIFDYAYYTDDSVNAANTEKWRYGSPDISNTLISGLRILAGAEFKSREFKIISATVPTLATYSEKYDLILQKYLGISTSLSAGVSKAVGQNGSADDFSRRLGFQSQFTRNWMFDINYNWSDQQKHLDQVLATLTWTESQGRSLASISHNSPDKSTSIRLAKNNLLTFDDYRLSVLASKQEPADSPPSQQLDITQDNFGRIFETRLRVFGTSTEAGIKSTTQVGLGSAIAWTTDGVALSRHISESFAIVSPQGLGEQSSLSVPNGSDKEPLVLKNDETFVFSNLAAYHNNNLQINSTELQNGYHLEREAYVIIPNYRSGVYIPLKVEKSIIATGRLKSENPEFRKYAYGKIWTKDGKLHSSNFFTDENGDFVIEGLAAGQYEIELSDPRLKRLPIEIKDSESTEVDLGEILVEKYEGT